VFIQRGEEGTKAESYRDDKRESGSRGANSEGSQRIRSDTKPD
jgi:hypothetical protein